MSSPRSAFAADSPGGDPAAAGAGAPKDKTIVPEEEDFTSTPFTQYGEFNEEESEDEELKFLQYGRFFGVSLGLGFETLDGGRANLWEGGFPVLDFRVHYWFDFNLAIDLGFYTASHYFDATSVTGGYKASVSIFEVGVDVKYYFDVKDLSAAISFANPYVIFGGGQFTKNQTPDSGINATSVNAFGVALGLGLEFAIHPKKSYFEIEGKAHIVNFPDDNTSVFHGITDDTAGRLYTVTGSFLFTW